LIFLPQSGLAWLGLFYALALVVQGLVAIYFDAFMKAGRLS